MTKFGKDSDQILNTHKKKPEFQRPIFHVFFNGFLVDTTPKAMSSSSQKCGESLAKGIYNYILGKIEIILWIQVYYLFYNYLRSVSIE